jgi:signal transduction histidine kinase
MQTIKAKRGAAHLASTNPPRTQLIAGVVVLNLFVAGIIWYSLYQSKLQYVDRAAVITQNITQVIDENISGIIVKVDIALQAVSDEAERQLATGTLRESSLNSFIVREHSRLPELVVFRATDEAGNAIYGPRVTPVKTTSLAHRDYFSFLRDTPHAGLVISKPLIGGISGKWMVILARRINRPDGTFAGLVYSGIGLEYLTKTFSKINIGEHGSIALVDSDLSLVARYPEFVATGSGSGQKITSRQFLEMFQAGRATGTYTTKSSIDSLERTLSFRKLSLSHPFYLFVGLATSDYLAGWRSEVFQMSLFMVIFILITVVLTRLLYREWCRSREIEEERLVIERQFLQAQKLESLGIMAGGIAHDFNNLLQAILGNIELAGMVLPLDAVAKKYITNAMVSGRQAAHLTNLMLTYVGKGFVDKQELNLNELIRENIDILKTTATSAVSVELSLADKLPAITANETQIQQVVMNLITNAAESIEDQPGTIRLTTGVRNCDQSFLAGSLLDEKPVPGRYVCMKVSDNGCGMSEETLKRLFDPFFTTKFTGRGLGMSAVMGIMKSHCGALFVDSEPGRGTTFKALFPVSDSVLTDTALERLPPNLPLEKGGTESNPEQFIAPENSCSGVVLVVDDEKSVLKVCSKMVTLYGFTTITACDGIDAVTKFREHADEIVVVLMDLTMPNMDGITAMNEILGIRPDAKVIISSGFNREELKERFNVQLPSGFIRKPYNMSELEAELRRIMGEEPSALIVSEKERTEGAGQTSSQ